MPASSPDLPPGGQAGGRGAGQVAARAGPSLAFLMRVPLLLFRRRGVAGGRAVAASSSMHGDCRRQQATAYFSAAHTLVRP